MKLKQWLSLPLAAALLAAAPAMAAEKFRVGYLRVMDDAQAIVAQEGGYYKKAGLDSELIEFKSGTDLIKAIIGGQLDTGPDLDRLVCSAHRAPNLQQCVCQCRRAARSAASPSTPPARQTTRCAVPAATVRPHPGQT